MSSPSSSAQPGPRGSNGGPWDMDITRRLLQQRIDSGEITQGDVDLFRRGYRYIILSTGLGALIGLPVWAFMSRRRPLPSLANRIGTSLIMSSSGSFLGFTIGGAAAAMEVNRHMVDSQRKVRVFEEIMQTSRRIAEDQRAGRPISLPQPYTTPTSTTTAGDESIESAGGSEEGIERFERRQEAEREQKLQEQGGGLSGGNGQGISSRTDISGSGSGTSWDRLRQGAFPRSASDAPASSASASSTSTSTSKPALADDARYADLSTGLGTYGQSVADRSGLSSTSNEFGTSVADRAGLGLGVGGGGMSTAEREKERREFEALLEKERRAGDEGFDRGKW